jgi:MFS family permease
MPKIALASVIGTTVEWYDLFVFGTASALVFYPSFDPIVGTMLAFGTFASACITRMVGAIIFGQFGDRRPKVHAARIPADQGLANFAFGRQVVA